MTRASVAAPPARYVAGAFSVLAGGLCWSFTGVFVRLAPHLDSWQFLIFRGLGVAAAFWLIGGRRDTISGLRNLNALGLVTTAALSVAAIGFIVALKMTSVATALFLSSCAPLLSALLGFLILGERLNARQISAVALGFCGLAIILSGGFEAGRLAGDLWGLACALSFATVSVCTRLAPRRDFGPAMVGYGILSAAVSAAVCLSNGVTLAPPPLEALAGFSGGFLLMGLGFTLFLRGAPKVPAVGQTMLAQTETIFGPVWVWLLFGETPPVTTLIGGVVILVAVVAMALAGAGGAPPDRSRP
jgi:drug/metabolite transporter (DMT)-like permease